MRFAVNGWFNGLVHGAFAFVALAGAMTGSRLLVDHTLGRDLRPAPEYWAFGALMAAGMLAIWWAHRANVLRGIVRSPAKVRELQARREAVERSKERLAEEFGNK